MTWTIPLDHQIIARGLLELIEGLAADEKLLCRLADLLAPRAEPGVLVLVLLSFVTVPLAPAPRRVVKVFL